MSKRNLRRIHVQSGATDRMMRPIDGVFEVFLDDDDIVDQMSRASQNRSRMSSCGPVVIVYRPANKAQSDFIVKGEAFGKVVNAGTTQGTEAASNVE